ncbi:MAG: 4-(cytidine 5'-diphospho)-2-C-methyl-D-erythritol kinase [Acidimicrobiia bacterium]|nr:4-(cytidine 5'-diphospho)-2-C-methyl-D-erythritol kinase [Acidimicrobiia bacterium]
METEPVVIEAAAKINLSLRIKGADAAGMHPLWSLVQSVDRCDRLTAALAAEDELEVGDADVSSERDNLIWVAIDAVRAQTGDRRPISFSLSKRIPVAAGLGGGSADAAGALLAASLLLDLPRSAIAASAPQIGADVPFCLQGGFAWMEGHGERLTAIERIPVDYALAVVVPPFTLDTGAVYRRWDRMAEPAGAAVDGKQLPPSLRGFGPFANDLYPAALDLRPELADWQAELADRWERPVMLSGSGPSLFAYFEDRDQATEAAELAPGEARARFAASPVPFGVRREGDSQARAPSH